METLGERVRAAREKAGLSVADLAGAADITAGALRLIEAGSTEHPRIDTLLSLARELGVPLEWLATGIPAVSTKERER